MSPLSYAFVSILLWSSLAFTSISLNHIPPFFLVGLALLIAGILSLPTARRWRIRPVVWIVGILGIFGYHFLLFASFRLAPPVESNLINYLWPILIVLATPLLLKNHALRPNHILGSILGLVGAFLIISGGRIDLRMEHMPGYLCAGAAALTWALYSVLTKRLAPFPTAAVGGFCLAAGLLSMGTHFIAEPATQISLSDGLIMLYLGVGPMGGAFFTWDRAMKTGDPRVIGALSYITPLLSTALLVWLGEQQFGIIALLALVLIVFGSILGGWEVIAAALKRARYRP